MSYSFEKVDGTTWDRELQQSPYASPFHEYAWNTMVAGEFGIDFQSYKVTRDDQRWLLPVYEIDGTAKSSYVGYGGPIALQQVADGSAELHTNREVLTKLKAILGVSAVSGTLYPAGFWPQDKNTVEGQRNTTIVPVHFSAEQLFQNIISGNCRTAVRKATKSGVQIQELQPDSDEDIEAALLLLQDTQEQVGSQYVTSRDFFLSINALHETNIDSKTYIANLDSKTIAMSTIISNHREAIHIFNGWDRSYAQYCANQALHWHAIQQASKSGRQIYNMGASHTTTLQASKLRWGGILVPVPQIHA